MKEKNSGIPSWAYLLMGLVAFGLYYGSKQLTGEDVMRLALGKKAGAVLSAADWGPVSPRILNHTGKIVSRKLKAGKPGPQQDSLTFHLVLKGEKATATIRTSMQRQPSGTWDVTKSDTVYSR
ncbi:hypothetical protein KLP40_11030 [Hymenobacter sp. NST-14]|uniref:hypothetical protein n=1 Tax=Hymenobacter piscis TaxID=2839984 RepID=UPI001C027E45|nr:hypothetical protein [Hymenobacter piscis]MBT9393697.1 hypothetical protein [Hymenobacter piscis]